MSLIDLTDPSYHPSPNVINLKGLNLSELPDALFKIEGIRTLYLSNNNLKTLPNELLSLKDLNTLVVADNPLESCPDLTTLKNLRNLILPVNMKKFPKYDRKNVRLRVT